MAQKTIYRHLWGTAYFDIRSMAYYARGWDGSTYILNIPNVVSVTILTDDVQIAGPCNDDKSPASGESPTYSDVSSNIRASSNGTVILESEGKVSNMSAEYYIMAIDWEVELLITVEDTVKGALVVTGGTLTPIYSPTQTGTVTLNYSNQMGSGDYESELGKWYETNVRYQWRSVDRKVIQSQRLNIQIVSATITEDHLQLTSIKDTQYTLGGISAEIQCGIRTPDRASDSPTVVVTVTYTYHTIDGYEYTNQDKYSRVRMGESSFALGNNISKGVYPLLENYIGSDSSVDFFNLSTEADSTRMEITFRNFDLGSYTWQLDSIDILTSDYHYTTMVGFLAHGSWNARPSISTSNWQNILNFDDGCLVETYEIHGTFCKDGYVVAKVVFAYDGTDSDETDSTWYFE